jgi:hypothetical protein
MQMKTHSGDWALLSELAAKLVKIECCHERHSRSKNETFQIFLKHDDD